MNAGLFGKFKGICTNNTDPDGLLRIKVKVPGLFDEELSEWALPNLPPGIYTIPEQWQGVWVEFEAGDENSPIWTGCWYDQKRKPSEAYKSMLTEAVIEVFNNHTHGADQRPAQKLDKAQHATKTRGR